MMSLATSRESSLWTVVEVGKWVTDIHVIGVPTTQLITCNIKREVADSVIGDVKLRFYNDYQNDNFIILSNPTIL